MRRTVEPCQARRDAKWIRLQAGARGAERLVGKKCRFPGVERPGIRGSAWSAGAAGAASSVPIGLPRRPAQVKRNGLVASQNSNAVLSIDLATAVNTLRQIIQPPSRGHNRAFYDSDWEPVR